MELVREGCTRDARTGTAERALGGFTALQIQSQKSDTGRSLIQLLAPFALKFFSVDIHIDAFVNVSWFHLKLFGRKSSSSVWGGGFTQNSKIKCQSWSCDAWRTICSSWFVAPVTCQGSGLRGFKHSNCGLPWLQDQKHAGNRAVWAGSGLGSTANKHIYLKLELKTSEWQGQELISAQTQNCKQHSTLLKFYGNMKCKEHN